MPKDRRCRPRAANATRTSRRTRGRKTDMDPPMFPFNNPAPGSPRTPTRTRPPIFQGGSQTHSADTPFYSSPILGLRLARQKSGRGLVREGAIIIGNNSAPSQQSVQQIGEYTKSYVLDLPIA